MAPPLTIHILGSAGLPVLLLFHLRQSLSPRAMRLKAMVRETTVKMHFALSGLKPSHSSGIHRSSNYSGFEHTSHASTGKSITFTPTGIRPGKHTHDLISHYPRVYPLFRPFQQISTGNLGYVTLRDSTSAQLRHSDEVYFEILDDLPRDAETLSGQRRKHELILRQNVLMRRRIRDSARHKSGAASEGQMFHDSWVSHSPAGPPGSVPFERQVALLFNSKWSNINLKTFQPPLSSVMLSGSSQTVFVSLLQIAHRLNQFSTVTLKFHGLGLVDAVFNSVFPDEETRPHFVVLHAYVNVLTSVAPYDIVCDEFPDLSFSVLPSVWLRRQFGHDNPSLEDIMRLAKLPPDSAIEYAPELKCPELTSLVGTVMCLSRMQEMRTKFIPAAEMEDKLLVDLCIMCAYEAPCVYFGCTSQELLHGQAYTFVRDVIKECHTIVAAGNEKWALEYPLDRLQALFEEYINDKGTQLRPQLWFNMRQKKPDDLRYTHVYMINLAKKASVPHKLNSMLQEFAHERAMFARTHGVRGSDFVKRVVKPGNQRYLDAPS